MARTLSLTLSVVLLLSILAVPTIVGVEAQTTPTTTTAFVTTTSTWVLTGPDGINPDYTSTVPPTTTTTAVGCISTPAPTVTTTAPPVSGELDLLTESDVGVGSGKIAVLSPPTEEYGMCADCYGDGSNGGDDLYVYPTHRGPWDASTARYLHMTVRTNMPFAIRVNSEYNSAAWFAKTAGTEEILPAGGYRFVIDLHEYMGQSGAIQLNSFGFTLHAAGSISIGHISLSNNPVCDEPIPNIQTTTKPSFPWDNTTTTTDWICDTTPPTTTTTVILTGPDGINPHYTTTLPTTTTTTNSPCVDFVDPDGFCDVCGRPMPGVTTTTTSATPIYTSGTPISSTQPSVVTTVSTQNPTVGDALLPGDIDGDCIVDMRDAFAIYKAVSGGDPLDDLQAALADMNYDGYLDMRDAFAIYRIASGG